MMRYIFERQQSPYGHVPDWLLVVGILICFFATAIVLRKAIIDGRKAKPELSSKSINNVETIAIAIAAQIRRAKDHTELSKAVEAIGVYEWQFPEDENAKREAKDLKELLDIRAAEVYGVQNIVS